MPIVSSRPSKCPFVAVALPKPIEPHEFRAVIENALEPFISIDDRGIVDSWNAQAETTFGWSRAEAIGRLASDLIVPEALRERHREKLQHYRFGSASDIVGKRVRVPSCRSDGTALTVELQVSATLSDDGSTRFHAFLHDVTALEAARAEIVRRESMLAESQQIAHLGSYAHDLRTGSVACSDELFAIVGLAPESFDGTIGPLVERIHPDDRNSAIAQYEVALAARAPHDFEHRVLRPDGETRIVRRRGHVTTDVTGAAVRVSATVHDVTDRRRADAARRAADARFTRSFEDSPFGLALVSAAPEDLGRFVLINDAFQRMLGYEGDDFPFASYADLFDPADAAKVLCAEEPGCAGAAARDRELRLGTKGGEAVWLRQHVSLMRDERGAPLHFFVHVEDVTRHRADRTALAAMHERLRRSIEDAPIGMALIRIEDGKLGTLAEVNAALCTLTGYDRDALHQTDLHALLDPADAVTVALACDQLVVGGAETLWIEARSARADGSRLWLSLNFSLVRDDGGGRYVILQIVDITVAKESEIRLEYLAFHDTLTGLLNRRGFERSVAAYFLKAAFSEPVAIAMIDVDYFKYVNDSFGHAAGDRVLSVVAQTLGALAAPREIVARLGGDEFVVVMPGLNSLAAIERSHHIRRQLALAVKAETERHLHVTASVGVATMEAGVAFTIDEALAAADLALSTAKETGRDRLTVAESIADTHRTLRGRMAWAQRIRSALADHRFRLHRQPILDLRTRRIDRYEFLLRLLDDDDRIVMPSLFLGEAERFGLLVDIDAWVVTEAIRIVAESSSRGDMTRYEVNLSAASLADQNIVTHVRAELERTKIDPRLLVFELTESTAIGNMEHARRLIDAVSALGCGFALDDFGAGFSSFYYLKRLPFDYLKIDGEFIVDILENEADRHIVRSIVALARGLGKRTIAEFVGSAEALELLASYGVDYAQGYHVGKPEPILETHAPLVALVSPGGRLG